MSRSIIKSSRSRRPELARFLGDAPLVGDEKQDDYDSFFAAIVSTLTQPDIIDELYLKDFVDLSWQIRRERLISADIIRLYQKDVILRLLKATRSEPNEAPDTQTAVYRIFGADSEAQSWLSDPVARKKIDADLEARGYSPSTVLAEAYINGAAEIDMVEHRIASYEARRMMALREIERRSEKSARQLERATSDIIDGDFHEAAE
jgi:hypothetical protein